MTHQADVVIIGGGISGLSAAKLLKAQGIDVIVVESRDRVGGRTYTHRDDDVQYVDLGGAYVAPTQNRIKRLAKDCGLDTYKVFTEGKFVQYSFGKIFRYGGMVPPTFNPFILLDTIQVWKTVDRLCQEIDIKEPWNCPHAKEWDAINVSQWLDKLCWTRSAKNFAAMFTRAVFAAEPEDISLLSWLRYIKSAGGRVMRLLQGTRPGGQAEKKFVGGAQQISEKIARSLGDRIFLSCPVHFVEQTTSGITVHSTDGQTFKARRGIIAIPPGSMKNISFNPPLHSLKAELYEKIPRDSIMKCIVYYMRAFWRDQGLCGLVVSDENGIPAVTADDSKPDGSIPALASFVTGENCRKFSLLTEEERKMALCDHFATTLNTEEALHPINYVEKNWLSEEYSGGACGNSPFPVHFLTKYARYLREPWGEVYFAGTETSIWWPGYMEGAVQAGERAAREILHAEGKISSSEIWQEEPEFEPSAPLPRVQLVAMRRAPTVELFAVLLVFTLVAIVLLASML